MTFLPSAVEAAQEVATLRDVTELQRQRRTKKGGNRWLDEFRHERIAARFVGRSVCKLIG